jgi:hypothetical protein
MSGSQGLLTYAQLLTQARTLLQDQLQPYRYADSELYFALTEAMADARRVRPDLFLVVGLDATPTFITAANAAQVFPLAWQYSTAFIDFIVGRAETRDDTYTDNGRATILSQRFIARLTGVTV